MKIRKIKWQNHEVLGNLELDFTKPDSSVFNNIILVGENGAGKTSALATVGSFLNIGNFDCFEYLEYEIGENKYRALHRSDRQSLPSFFRLEDLQTGTIVEINSNKNNNPKSITQSEVDPRNNGCVITKARADYKTDPIKHTSTMKLDEGMYDADESDSYTSLKQLIVDVQNQDNKLFYELNKNKSRKQMVTDAVFKKQYSRMQRFTQAFDTFFSDSGLRFSSVEDLGDHKEIFFEKHGSKIPIDGLSTGEKQIVYRGAYLLKNLKKLAGGTAFIDEPELSMHPLWQKKILQYYQGLFVLESGQQQTQLFFASHSNFVLETALANPDDNLILLLKNDAGVVRPQKVETTERVLPYITSAEVNFIVFKLYSRDYHNELYGYLQIKAGAAELGRAYNIKECDDYIKRQVQYDATQHHKTYSYTDKDGKLHMYETLPSYIRNCIDHPNPTIYPEPSAEEMNTSIILLREICR